MNQHLDLTWVYCKLRDLVYVLQQRHYPYTYSAMMQVVLFIETRLYLNIHICNQPTIIKISHILNQPTIIMISARIVLQYHYDNQGRPIAL